MIFEEQTIKGIFVIKLKPFKDARGWFARMFCENEMKDAGIPFLCKQINHSFTEKKGSFRGIHYQHGAFAEYKLIRCISGSVLDIGVDLRQHSDTLFKSFSIELSEENETMLLLPPGVGHAFQTLKDHSALIYCHSSFYNPSFEGGVRYDDPKINLHLPLKITDLSDRDQQHPFLNPNFTGLDI